MPVAPKSILIGIPSFRRPGGLRNLLASLESQEHVETEHIQVFVADNDSRGRDAKQVCEDRACGFRWPLECEIVSERGISAARNAILDRALKHGSDFVAMLDDDEIAGPTWLREMLRTQNHFAADVVGGPVYFHFDEEPSRAVRACGLFGTPFLPEGVVPMIDATNNVLLSCVALESAEWPRFDDAFGLTGGGDREFFTRLRKRGFRFAWSPRAVVTETVPATRSRPSWVLRRAFRIGNGDMRIAQMHAGIRGTAVSLGKAVILILASPVCWPILFLPSRRLWIVGKWSRSVGKIAALLGRQYREYARR
jgi:glycosyltransferase involved in cell wall biosynthesis